MITDMEGSHIPDFKFSDLANTLEASLPCHTAKNTGVDHGVCQDPFRLDKRHRSSNLSNLACHHTLENSDFQNTLGPCNHILGRALLTWVHFKNQVTA